MQIPKLGSQIIVWQIRLDLVEHLVQLFEATMQFFDLPPHVVRVLSDLRG
jgi:hypothetical protein